MIKPTPKKNYNKDCNFIVLHDRQLFESLQMPSNPTNFMIWYKKAEPNFWGLTIKCTPSGNQFDSQHVWKATWFHNDGVLKPTVGCTSLNLGNVDGDLYNRLCTILQDHQNKNKK